MKKWRDIIIILIIFILAAFLRFYRIEDFPVGFQQDEASLGYNAYSLLRTGRDENGKPWPVYIDTFGDYRPAGYFYLTIPTVALWGLNEFGVRLPAVIFGTITPLAIFFLAKSLFGKKEIGFLALFLTAVSPWHITVSRASAETVVALFFVILGSYFYLEFMKKEKVAFFPFSLLSFIVSYLFYHTPRVFVPLLVISLTILLFRSWQNWKLSLKILIFSQILVLGLIALMLVFGIRGGTGRFTQVSIFNFPEIRLVLEEQIREEGKNANPIITRFFHNKIVNYSLGFLDQYAKYFTVDFIFLKGGLPPWYITPSMGLMYLVELPFFLSGIYFLISRKTPLTIIPIMWLVLGPMVAALTVDDVPNIQRSLVMAPALCLITAVGFIFLTRTLSGRQKSLFHLVVFLVFTWNFLYFLHQYFVHSRVHRPWYRSNGYKELIFTLEDFKQNYKRVIITKGHGGAYINFLFWLKFDPALYQQLGSPKDNDYQGFDKYIFVPEDCPLSTTIENKHKIAIGEPGVIYVNKGECEVPELKVKLHKSILREDRTPAFRILEYVE